ncbi:MAG TPA: cyclopropane fatty acyl phospholipid synthase [Gammaproteobacteria bacterium]|nr:cyclopropane fatty acyl phospholipid synthase [Gammaproteobacteria bacterium]
MDKAEATIRGLVELAGIEINGSAPHDIQVNDPLFYRQLLGGGALGFGETYMQGLWDCEALDTLIYRLLRADLEHRISPLKLLWPVLWSKLVNLQSRNRAFHIGKHHYDIGNELYQRMLDPRMTYTCGYWKEADNLNDAQEAKLDLVCRKVGLEPGMRVLDIGCGWGSFAGFAAERYGVKVVGVTVSREQIELGQERYRDLDVDLRFQDYRDVNERFDRIISIGMFEHVGPRNYRTYMKVVENCLEDDGLFLLHTIGTNTKATAVDPWTNKYIFPGGVLPLPEQIDAAVSGIFIMEDLHNIGTHYDPTLMAWMANVDAHREELENLGYDPLFYRMWRYFLLSSAGSARARRNQLWQIVYSKKGLDGGYDSIR